MPQTSLPEVVISAPGWTGTVADVGEVVRDDETFMLSGLAPTGGSPLLVRLTDLLVPNADTGHSLKYVIGKNAAAGAQLDVLVEILEGPPGVGEVVIDSWTHTDIDETDNLFTQTLDTTPVGDITDDGYLMGLYVRITPTQEAAPTAPTVTSVDEDVIPNGQVLTITGTNFTGTPSVWFDSTEETATVVVNSSTEIEVTIPDVLTPGTYTVEVENADGTSSDGVTIVVPALVRNVIGSDTPDSSNTTTYAQDATEALAAYARLVAWIASADTVDPVHPTAAGWGLTWTEQESVGLNPDANFRRLTLLTAVTGGAGASASSLTATFSDAQTGAMIEVAEYTYSPACPFVPALRQVEPDAGSSNAPTVDTLAALGPNAAVAAGFLIGRAAPAITPDTGWDELLDTGFSLPNTGLAIIGKVGTTDNTPSGTWSTGGWAAIGVEVG